MRGYKVPDSEPQHEQSRWRARTAAGERGSWRLLGGLVGLIVVGVVLAALLGALTWFLGPSREEGLRDRCRSDLKSLGLAINQYAGDFDDRCPWRKGAGDPRAAWCDLGLLYPKYASYYGHFFCPASQDKRFKLAVPDESGEYPEFAELAADDSSAVISYGYCFDGPSGRPWSLWPSRKAVRRLLADKKAGTTATGLDLQNAAHQAKGRNVLYTDGHVEWVEGTNALDPDPEDDDVGAPGARDYADWWSDPPYYGE